MSPDPLDVAALRAQFPGLSRTTPGGRRVAFLDGPGGSQPHGTAVEAVAAHLRTSMANDDGAFPTSRETTALIGAARDAAADFLGASADEIAFGQNMTTLNFLLAHAVARTLGRGDEIVVTELDHDANVSPWLAVARDHDLVVRTAPIRTGDGTLDLEALEGLLGPRTKVVAFTLASNALGSVPDARRVAAAAHRAGALAWADGVHYAPHRRIDRDAFGVDVVVCSPYKFFGPHLGMAAIRRDLAESLPADRVRPATEDPPGHRFETGTQPHEALAGLIAAVDYIARLGSGHDRRARLTDAYGRIGRHEAALAARFLLALRGVPGLRLYGIADPGRVSERTPTFCFRLHGHTPREVAEALADDGVFVWDGDYYALNVMRAFGLADDGGAVRVGLLHYNTADEVDRCAEALVRLARQAA